MTGRWDRLEGNTRIPEERTVHILREGDPTHHYGTLTNDLHGHVRTIGGAEEVGEVLPVVRRSLLQEGSYEVHVRCPRWHGRGRVPSSDMARHLWLKMILQTIHHAYGLIGAEDRIEVGR